MPRGFYVSSAYAAEALQLLYGNKSGNGFRFHGSIFNRRLSIYADPVNFDTICREVTEKLRADRTRVMGVVADDDGLVMAIIIVNRALYQSGSLKRLFQVYDDTMWARYDWDRWSSPGTDYQYTDKTIADGLRHCGETIAESTLLAHVIATGLMPSQVVRTQANPLLGRAACVEAGAVAQHQARRAEMARRGLL